MIDEKVLKRKYFKFLIKWSSHGMEIYLRMFPVLLIGNPSHAYGLGGYARPY